MRTGLLLVTGPTVEPITTANAKAWLRVDSSSDDTLIDALVATARRHVENYTGKALISQTWAYWLDRFPPGGGATPWWDGVRQGAVSSLYQSEARHIEIPKGPVSALTSVSTFDLDDVETALSASTDYRLDDSGEIQRVVLRDGAVWPTELRESKAIKVLFVAGYGATAASVPDPLIVAMKMLLAHWYENREAVVTGTTATELPLSVKVLLDPYRTVTL